MRVTFHSCHLTYASTRAFLRPSAQHARTCVAAADRWRRTVASFARARRCTFARCKQRAYPDPEFGRGLAERMTVLFANSLRLGAPLILALALPCAHARAQSQDAQGQQSQSVADAARRTRQQKKNISKSASKIITDDDLDTKNFKPGAEGLNVGSSPKSDAQPPSPAPVASAEAADNASGATASSRKPGEDPELANLKERIAQVQKELDLLQRELSLDQDSYYSQPEHSRDSAGKAKLDSERQRINDKQQDLDALKTRLAASLELQDRKKSH